MFIFIETLFCFCVCARAFLCVFIFLFSLCTDKIFYKCNKTWICMLVFFMRIQCAFRWCTMWSNFVQHSCIRLPFWTAAAVAHNRDMNSRNKWTHVQEKNNETKNHSAQQKGEGWVWQKQTHKAFIIHFTLALYLRVSLLFSFSLFVCVRDSMATYTHAHSTAMFAFNALIYL